MDRCVAGKAKFEGVRAAFLSGRLDLVAVYSHMNERSLGVGHYCCEFNCTADFHWLDELDIVDKVDLRHANTLPEHVRAKPAQFKRLSHDVTPEYFSVEVAIL